MAIRQTIEKYKDLIQADNYTDLFKKCDNNERLELVTFIYGHCGINILDYLTEIPNELFMDVQNISVVTIPKNIIKIGTGAFQGSSLSKVIIPDTIKILQDFTFANTRLTKIFIPSSVIQLKRGVFDNTSESLVIGTPVRNSNNLLRVPIDETNFYDTHLRYVRTSNQ